MPHVGLICILHQKTDTIFCRFFCEIGISFLWIDWEEERERERGIEEKWQKFVLELQFFFKKRFCAFSSSSSPNLFNIFWLEMRSSTLDFLTNALLIFWTETVRHCAKIWMANFGAKKTFPSKIYYSMPFPSYSYPVSSLFLTSFKIKELLFNWNWFMNSLCKRMK